MRSTMLAVGVPILAGTEKVIEAWLLAMSPEWLTAITTRFLTGSAGRGPCPRRSVARR